MKKMLWIEDNFEVGAELTPILEENGIDVYSAPSLRSADYKIERIPGLNNIDVLITDLNMDDYPKFEETYTEYRDKLLDEIELNLTGLVWLKRFIEQHPEFSQKRIAVFSGYIENRIVEELRSFAPEVEIIDKLAPDLKEKLIGFIQNSGIKD